LKHQSCYSTTAVIFEQNFEHKVLVESIIGELGNSIIGQKSIIGQGLPTLDVWALFILV